MLMRAQGAVCWSPAKVSWEHNLLLAEGLGHAWKIPMREGGSHIRAAGHDALVTLAARLEAEGFDLRCCSGCAQFRSQECRLKPIRWGWWDTAGRPHEVG